MRKIIAGNFKMNMATAAERKWYVSLFRREFKNKKFGEVDIILCPPSVCLEYFAGNIKNKKVFFGAQNVFMEREGAYTGEISALMVKESGGSCAIVGHSERRRLFSETNETANLKIKTILKNQMIPIYCFGESRSERDANLTKKVITEQIQKGLTGVSSIGVERVIFAYEPIWSVGTDVIPAANEIMEVKILVRKILTELYSSKAAQSVKILYGGSVNSRTVGRVCVDPAMDGALVGRESLNPREFLKIAEIIDKN